MLTQKQKSETSERMDISEQGAAWLLEENRRLSLLVMIPFSEHFFTKDSGVRMYIGFPSLRMLKCVLAHVSSGMDKSGWTKLTPSQEMAVALVKLRLDLLLHDLPCRMGVATSTVSRILLKRFAATHIRLRHLIRWPDR